MPAWEARTHLKLGEEQRLEALRRLLLDDEIHLHWRVAGSFVPLYRRPADRVVELSLDHLSAPEEGLIRVRLARDWVDVPEPLATLVRSPLSGRSNMQTAANRDCSWLFPGSMPGRPMNVDGLVTNLRRIGVPVMATKTGAWQQLVREGTHCPGRGPQHLPRHGHEACPARLVVTANLSSTPSGVALKSVDWSIANYPVAEGILPGR